MMQEAINLSLEGMADNEGGPFGAVIVFEEKIVARGWNQVTSTLDPTAHAEVVAIRTACKTLQRFQLSGCDIYCSCEPCPMCLSAIYWARLDRVFYAASSTDAAEAGFDDLNFYCELRKPCHERSVFMQQLLRHKAQAVLEAWSNTTDRIRY